MTIADKQADRARLVKEMRAVNDAANGRAWTGDETEKYAKLEAEVDRLGAEIEAEQKQAQRATKLADLEKALETPGKPATKPAPAAEGRTDPRIEEARSEVFRNYLATGRVVEQRVDTLQVGLLTKGGYLQPPQEFVASLIQAIDNSVFVRQNARKFALASAESLGVPTLDTDVEDFSWTSELLTGAQTDVAVGKRELRPHPMAKRVKVSKTLVRASAISIDQLVRERLAYKAGVTMENAYLNGDGAQKPLGIFTASADGVPVSQDVSTDNSATGITADGLINAKHAMKAAYWRTARWCFHRDAVKQIRKIKDGDGNYIWGMGLAGQPDTLLNLPIDVSEYVPNTFTSGLYVGALCNWQFYWIADALDMTVQFLDQLYAETNQNGYIARMESDGKPVLAEAFIRVKLG